MARHVVRILLQKCKKGCARINIVTIPLYVRTFSENQKCAPIPGATFWFSEELRTYNGIVTISNRAAAFFIENA